MKKILPIVLILLANLAVLYSQDITSNLKAYWSFDYLIGDTLPDLSNNNNFGIINRGPILKQGKKGNAIHLDGTQFVEINNKRFLDGSCNVTFSCWICPEFGETGKWQLLTASDGFRPNYDPISFQFMDYKPFDFSFQTTIGENKAIRSHHNSFGKRLKKNEWQFWAVSLCADENISILKIYVNGELIQTIDYLSNASTYQPIGQGKLCMNYDRDMRFLLGSVDDEPYWKWIGMIDEMRFYDRCLTDEEVELVYEMDNPIIVNDCAPVEFELEDVINTDINYIEQAKVINDYIRLSRAAGWKSGAIWYRHLVPVSNGFETTFSFKISDGFRANPNEYSEAGGDGIVFVIQNESDSIIGGEECLLGYTGIPYS